MCCQTCQAEVVHIFGEVGNVGVLVQGLRADVKLMLTYQLADWTILLADSAVLLADSAVLLAESAVLLGLRMYCWPPLLAAAGCPRLSLLCQPCAAWSRGCGQGERPGTHERL